MERKRSADGDGSSHMPPAKHSRHSESHTSPGAVSSRATTAATSDDANDVTPQHVQEYQKAQLIALLEDQRKEMKWLRDKIDEQTHLVSFLDAAPRAALYHMGAVREELTLTLARLGLPGNLKAEDCPIAATLLNVEEISNESLGKLPSIIKKLTAQIILALEKEHKTVDADGKAARNAALDLHNRVRDVSEQMERFATREKNMLIAQSNITDELEDCRNENAMRRNRIVNLEQSLRSKDSSRKHVGENGVGDGASVSGSAKRSTDNANGNASLPSVARRFSDANGVSNDDDLAAELESERKLSTKRLAELEEMHAVKKQLVNQLEAARNEIAKRDAGVIPMKQVLSTSLYQTMEATLQQLYLKERKWQDERETLLEEVAQERKLAEERYENAKRQQGKVVEDYKRQVGELQKHVDFIKAEKDKAAMSYEARKMEAGSVATVTAAWEKRYASSEEMREKATTGKAALQKDLDTTRTRLQECERLLAERVQSSDGSELIKLLRQELEDEKKKAASFIDEVEALSNLYSELEIENERVVKLVTEKEQVLSKVMGERLRARQQLTTAKEENKALTNHRSLTSERIKNMTAVVNASKKLATDAQIAHNLAVEETRKISAQLERRRRIADEMTVKARTAMAEKEEMKKERDVLKQRAEANAVAAEEDRYTVKRLREQNESLKRRVDSHEAEDGKDSHMDEVRDEMIRELQKKLNCSVVPSHRKDVVLTRCGHLFSKKCTDNLISTRNRKCPMCGKTFGVDDVMAVYF